MYKSRTELWEKSVRSHEGHTQSPILVVLMRKYFRGSDTRSCGGFQAGVMAGAKALRQREAQGWRNWEKQYMCGGGVAGAGKRGSVLGAGAGGCVARTASCRVRNLEPLGA